MEPGPRQKIRDRSSESATGVVGPGVFPLRSDRNSAVCRHVVAHRDRLGDGFSGGERAVPQGQGLKQQGRDCLLVGHTGDDFDDSPCDVVSALAVRHALTRSCDELPVAQGRHVAGERTIALIRLIG